MSKSNRASGSGRQGVDSDAIAKRAYELYLQRGSVPGYELDDWLQAEAEVAAASGAPAPKVDSGDDLETRRQPRAPEGAAAKESATSNGEARRTSTRERSAPRRALRQ